jgi:hypothetical protein
MPANAAINEVIIYRRVLSVAEIAQVNNAGPCIYDRSFAKGTLTLQGTVRNRLGALIPVEQITTEDWWVQHSLYAKGRPLRITGTSVDLVARKNVLTIGDETADEAALGLRMGELMAIPDAVTNALAH